MAGIDSIPGLTAETTQYLWPDLISFIVSNIILVFLKAVSSRWVCRITPWFSAAFSSRM